MSRTAEVEADAFAVSLMERAGYDAASLPRYIGRSTAAAEFRDLRLARLPAAGVDATAVNAEFEEVRQILRRLLGERRAARRLRNGR